MFISNNNKTNQNVFMKLQIMLNQCFELKFYLWNNWRSFCCRFSSRSSNHLHFSTTDEEPRRKHYFQLLSCEAWWCQCFMAKGWFDVDVGKYRSISEPPISNYSWRDFKHIQLSCKFSFIIDYKIIFKWRTCTQIQNLTASDTGKYRCQINFDLGKVIAKEVDLQVTRPPIILDVMETNVRVSEGQSATLLCKADGFPKPEIVWRRDNEEVFFSKGNSYR